jgi:hypothetical protein
MSQPPAPTLIYHITHVDNLASVVRDGGLVSDAEMVAHSGPNVTVGMSSIKQRRMSLPVKCHPGDLVGEYVPFYFCPRSIMLYILHRANHPELSYRGGQTPIVHLELDLRAAADWAEASGLRWAFTLSNAGAYYTEFRDDLAQLSEVDWDAVANPDFTSASVKEGKQAEFLVQQCVPWDLVERVGVRTAAIQAKAKSAIAGSAHQPPVVVLPRWYF